MRPNCLDVVLRLTTSARGSICFVPLREFLLVSKATGQKDPKERAEDAAPAGPFPRSRWCGKGAHGSEEAAAPIIMFACSCVSLIVWENEATATPGCPHHGKSTVMGGKRR